MFAGAGALDIHDFPALDIMNDLDAMTCTCSCDFGIRLCTCIRIYLTCFPAKTRIDIRFEFVKLRLAMAMASTTRTDLNSACICAYACILKQLALQSTYTFKDCLNCLHLRDPIRTACAYEYHGTALYGFYSACVPLASLASRSVYRLIKIKEIKINFYKGGVYKWYT